MDPHSIVVVSLHTPKEKVWGELLAINPSGITLERISLDEASGSIPSMNELFARKVGRSLSDYLAQFA